MKITTPSSPSAFFKLSFLISVTALCTGSAVAFFLVALQFVTTLRFAQSWLLYLLPLAGLGIHFLYRLAGKSAEKGNNLIIEEIHQPGGGVPGRLAPLVLFSTLATHLFGGSAGREGTAVQLGGSLADLAGRWFSLADRERSLLLIAGLSAGFGAVFGTPITGAIFAIEVLTLRRMRYAAFLPALLSSYIGDFTVSAWGVKHTAYVIAALPSSGFGVSLWPFQSLLWAKAALAAAVFGVTAWLFVEALHKVKAIFLAVIKKEWAIPFAGGIVIILLTLLINRSDYLGLGVLPESPQAVTLSSAFHPGGATTWSWLLKMGYTVITLASGFKGGEVTPLFYIGATLGNTLAAYLGAPVSLFAALGFIAVFAGATNTPLACTVMGVELFGPQHLPLFAIACFVAYFFSGHGGIYAAQRGTLESGSGAKAYWWEKWRKYF